MIPVSSEFLAAIGSGMIIETKATVNDIPVALVSGSIRGQVSNVRRSFSGDLATLDGDYDGFYDFLSQDGAILKVITGIPDLNEWVPMFIGRLNAGSAIGGQGHVPVSASDFGFDLAQQELLTPVTQAASVTRLAAIEELVSAGFPSVNIHNSASDTGTLGSEQVWSGSRWDAINTIAKDAGAECYFDPSGDFIIRDQPAVSTPVYSYNTGSKGTVISLERSRPLDQLINTVVVSAASTTGNQDWDSVTVQITDTDHPRHPSRIGVRVLRIDSPTANETDAAAIASRELDKALGRTETLNVQAVGNPAIELGDTVGLSMQGWLDSGTQTWTHIIDGFSFDLKNWSQQLETRSYGYE